MATAAAPATIGEAVAGMSRVTLTLKAAVVQIVLVGYFVLCGRSFQDTDPLFYSSLPWRVPLAVSWFACIWLFFLMLGCIEIFLPRTPMAVDEALRWVGAVVGLVVIMVGGGVLGLSARNSVVVGCTCFMALIIAGLLVVWRWLVREYGGEASDMCTEKHSEVTTDNWHIYQPPV